MELCDDEPLSLFRNVASELVAGIYVCHIWQFMENTSTDAV